MGNFNAIHNINDKDSPVKLKIQKNADSLQFKRWFDHSKVVNANGEPLVVYYGLIGRDGNLILQPERFFSEKEDYAER